MGYVSWQEEQYRELQNELMELYVQQKEIDAKIYTVEAKLERLKLEMERKD